MRKRTVSHLVFAVHVLDEAELASILHICETRYLLKVVTVPLMQHFEAFRTYMYTRNVALWHNTPMERDLGVLTNDGVWR